MQHFILDVVDSTNDMAKTLARKKTPLPFVVTADRQTNGRGRRGHTFYSPATRGLYLSVALPLPHSLAPGQMTCLAAVAAAKGIQTVLRLDIGFKWLNDLWFDGKKVGGILCERVDDVLIVGIGINIWTANFPAALATTAGALLFEEPDRDWRPELTEAIARAVVDLLQEKNQSAALSMAVYRARLVHKGLPIMVEHGDARTLYFCRDVADDGHLLASGPDGALHRLDYENHFIHLLEANPS